MEGKDRARVEGTIMARVEGREGLVWLLPSLCPAQDWYLWHAPSRTSHSPQGGISSNTVGIFPQPVYSRGGFKEGVSAAKNKQRVALVVSHELAHQWFGKEKKRKNCIIKILPFHDVPILRAHFSK